MMRVLRRPCLSPVEISNWTLGWKNRLLPLSVCFFLMFRRMILELRCFDFSFLSPKASQPYFRQSWSIWRSCCITKSRPKPSKITTFITFIINEKASLVWSSACWIIFFLCVLVLLESEELIPKKGQLLTTSGSTLAIPLSCILRMTMANLSALFRDWKFPTKWWLKTCFFQLALGNQPNQ